MIGVRVSVFCGVRGGNISASHDTYTGTVTILPELTVRVRVSVRVRGEL